MKLTRITEVGSMLGLTSRSLRYYEEAGLIQSVRRPGEKYRFYDEETIERLRQILVLRKMLIPIKDILRIYQSREMSVVVEVFVNRLQELDEEAAALSKLRRITDDFLQTMIRSGVNRISALPLLYEALEKQETEAPEHSFEELQEVSRQLLPLPPFAILSLPPMRVLTSILKSGEGSDQEGFWAYIQRNAMESGSPGRHERFLCQEKDEDVSLLRINDEYQNESPFEDRWMEGGLFASTVVYLDEDIRERLHVLMNAFDSNASWQLDYASDGRLRQEAMLEPLLSPDELRSQMLLLVPVKRRVPDPSAFAAPIELDREEITIEQIEQANPVLWSREAAMDQLQPINGPHYRVTADGEAEYVSWISTRVLSTNISVQLPFRVDVTFRIGEDSGGWGHDRNETSLRFHHGDDLNFLFGINMDNNPDERLSRHAICFHQPIYGDYYSFAGKGAIRRYEENTLTWIVGMQHMAVIINGELRYCGVQFPYMRCQLWQQPSKPIIMGSNGSIYKYFRSIRVSQLAMPSRFPLKAGVMTLNGRRSNHQLSRLHRVITSEFGENYHFNGCAAYLMECAGEKKWDYWFFAGLTGDLFAQVYSNDQYVGECVSSCRSFIEGGNCLESFFEQCGYESTFVPSALLHVCREQYLEKLMAEIDRGIPVLAVVPEAPRWRLFVGYEEHGKTLLYLAEDRLEPERVSAEAATAQAPVQPQAFGWLFLGEKKRQASLKHLYRAMIERIPALFDFSHRLCCFGPKAFYSWAERIENGFFVGMQPEHFDAWDYHVSNICNMATNGSCAHEVLKRVKHYWPEWGFLDALGQCFKRTEQLWNRDRGQDLEALGGGFNVTLEALQHPERRKRIAERIREAGAQMELVQQIIRQHLK